MSTFFSFIAFLNNAWFSLGNKDRRNQRNYQNQTNKRQVTGVMEIIEIIEIVKKNIEISLCNNDHKHPY